MAQGPLEQIRVLDLSSYIAGAYAGMMLADLGAEVVKVESLDGDSFRELPGFYGWNRGKRSIAVNLKERAGREIVHRLARRADVALENMRPGVTARLEIDYDTLRGLNPRIVYCSVTAFGADGPYRDRPGFDPLLQAMGGVMELQGWGGAPQYLRIPIVDYYAAALACQGVLAALFARERTGRGQKVETSLLDAVLALQSGNVADYPGKEIVYRENPTYRLYQGSDGGWFFLACGNQSFWAKLCGVLERPDLAADPRFGSFLLRRDNADALVPVLEAAFGSKRCEEWLRILAANDIPCAPVQTLSALMSDPAVSARGRRVDYMHPVVGPLRMMGLPLQFSDTRGEAGARPPLLGEHGTEILGELGYGDEAIADLRSRRIVG